MYPHFIEVHDVEDDSLIAINIDSIACVMKGTFQDAECGLINCRDAGGQVTKESYDELKQLIADCGCHIEKGDPRLDQTKPLTMADLKHMIGEPVWNSNTRCWLLVSEDRGDTVYLIFNNGNGYDFHENALIKYPLYRMKR